MGLKGEGKLRRKGREKKRRGKEGREREGVPNGTQNGDISSLLSEA
jgi:hypothetical protein